MNKKSHTLPKHAWILKCPHCGHRWYCTTKKQSGTVACSSRKCRKRVDINKYNQGIVHMQKEIPGY